MNRFMSKDENRRAIDGAMAMLTAHGRGTVVGHDELAASFGVAPLSQKYYYLAQVLKRKLREGRSIQLVSVPLVGYELVTIKGQLEASRNQYIRGTRRVRESRKIVSAIPEAECSVPELRAKTVLEERVGQHEKDMRDEAQRMSFLMRPRQQTPRPSRDEEPIRVDGVTRFETVANS